jgi:hypothetical protein
MPDGMHRFGMSALMLAIAFAAPAEAQTGCWSEADMDAAKIRDLQSRLMVATLRCQGAGVDVTAAYNHFVIANRATLQGINGVLMSRFRSDASDAEAQVQYDRYATALANAYGGDTTNRRVCDNSARLAEEAAGAEGNVGRLVALHSLTGMPPPRPGDACRGRPVLEAARPDLPRPVAGSRQADAARSSDQGGGLGWLVIDDE